LGAEKEGIFGISGSFGAANTDEDGGAAAGLLAVPALSPPPLPLLSPLFSLLKKFENGRDSDTAGVGAALSIEGAFLAAFSYILDAFIVFRDLASSLE
jgi:hypothetical protein